jgi:hypothetical protein
MLPAQQTHMEKSRHAVQWWFGDDLGVTSHQLPTVRSSTTTAAGMDAHAHEWCVPYGLRDVHNRSSPSICLFQDGNAICGRSIWTTGRPCPSIISLISESLSRRKRPDSRGGPANPLFAFLPPPATGGCAREPRTVTGMYNLRH